MNRELLWKSDERKCAHGHMPRNQNRVGNIAKVTHADIQIRCQAGALKSWSAQGWVKKCSGFQPLLLRIDQMYGAGILIQQANCQTKLTMPISPKALKKSWLTSILKNNIWCDSNFYLFSGWKEIHDIISVAEELCSTHFLRYKHAPSNLCVWCLASWLQRRCHSPRKKAQKWSDGGDQPSHPHSFQITAERRTPQSPCAKWGLASVE